MRASTQSLSPLQFVLEPRRLIRWIYVGRLTIATALIVTALVTWKVVENDKTLVATLCFVGAIFVTAAAFTWTEVNGRPQTEAFIYSQLVTDLLVVTAVVHVTGGSDSQFAALYIVVNTAAALLLPPGRTILVSLLGIVLYVLDALTLLNEGPDLTLVLRLVVFSVVAVGTGYISARLKQAGQGREKLAAELATVRLREKDILANIRSGIITVDTEGDLLFANAPAGELLGLDLETFQNRPVIGALREAAPVLAAVLERSLRDGSQTLRAEGTTTVAGRHVPFGVTITSASGEGQPAGRTVTAIFQDISDQKRLEQLNLRAQRLEAVAELSASLAHEIKNPLASIRSAVEQLSARPNATSDERTLGNLIVRESDRLSRLLSEFLDFSRVRATRRDRVPVAAVVQGAAALASEHPERTGDTRIEVVIGTGPLEVFGDEDLLHRVVFNLTLNALQSTRPGTVVRVTAASASAEQLPTGVHFEGGAIAIQVADEGPGIPAAVQDRLFEPFTTTKSGGTGLGLAITHRAVGAHGGIVLVDSNDSGTRFTVLLPRAAVAEPAGRFA